MALPNSIYGRNVTIYNDHKPLAAALRKPVADNPVRLQRVLCRIMGYDFEFKYIKVKDLVIADALSRSQTTNQNRRKRKKFKRTQSSPHQHQSNGKSEWAVKIVKTSLRKSAKTTLNPYEGLLNQRCIHQRFLNRRTRTEIQSMLLSPELSEVLQLKKKRRKPRNLKLITTELQKI